eukprot:1606902-Prymnesium_polylepis.2
MCPSTETWTNWTVWTASAPRRIRWAAWGSRSSTTGARSCAWQGQRSPRIVDRRLRLRAARALERTR